MEYVDISKYQKEYHLCFESRVLLCFPKHALAPIHNKHSDCDPLHLQL